MEDEENMPYGAYVAGGTMLLGVIAGIWIYWAWRRKKRLEQKAAHERCLPQIPAHFLPGAGTDRREGAATPAAPSGLQRHGYSGAGRFRMQPLSPSSLQQPSRLQNWPYEFYADGTPNPNFERPAEPPTPYERAGNSRPSNAETERVPANQKPRPIIVSRAITA